MLDDERMSHIGTFSAVCSPPISMMYKGRKRSSSKLLLSKKMEQVVEDALDEDIWAGLLKISKSSEELWKDVYAVFSPPTPIGSKAPEYSPFQPPASRPATSSDHTEADGSSSSSNNNNSNGNVSADAGMLGRVAGVSRSTNRVAGKSTTANIATAPFVPTVPEKTAPQGATVTNSISIAQVPQTSITVQPATADKPVEDKRPKRHAREVQSNFLTVPGKKPSSKSTPTSNAFNPSNIHSIIHSGDREDSSSHASRAPQVQHHPQRHDLHEPNHHHMSNLNTMNITMNQMQMHNTPSLTPNHPPHAHPHHNSQLDSMDTSHRGHPVFDNRTVNGLNHSINTTHHSQPIYMHSPSPMYNIDSPLLPCTDSGHDPRNCNCNTTSGHNNYTHPPSINLTPFNNTNANNTNNVNNNSNNNNNNNNNDKWNEVILYCSKLTTLASSGLANNLTFAQLADGVNLARQITTATAAAILNSSSYPPFQSTSVSDELNRLVMENLGPLGFSNPQSPNTVSPHSDNSHLTPRGGSYSYYSTPPINSLPSPSMTYSSSAPPSAFSSPTSYSSPPFNSSPATMSNSSSINSLPPTSSWSNEGAFANFVELRRKLPVPNTNSSPRSDSEDESPDLDSPRSPPALSVVPLSPCLSPGGSSATVPPQQQSENSNSNHPGGSHRGGDREKGKEAKSEKDEKGTWRKPRGKKRQKYEADLECRSCGVRQTPEWRRGPFGAKTLCNACGLHWAKVLKAEGKGDQKRVALLEAKRSQFMMTQKRGTTRTTPPSGNNGSIKNEPLYLSPHISQ